MKAMNCNEARQISIVDYLAKCGFKPRTIKGADHWYLSPLREEKHASFKVNSKLNAWFDFGTSEGGNLIDLGIRLHCCSVDELLARLSTGDHSLSFHPSIPQAADEPEKKIVIQQVGELENLSLISYLHSRGIDYYIAKAHCQEVNFTVNNKVHTAIGFANRSGGYELRNGYLKLSSSPKDLSLIDGGTNDIASVHVVEGFMDLLSFLTVKERDITGSFMVLNSLSFVKRCLELLPQYRYVFLYLDHDAAGKKAIDTITQAIPHSVDASLFYQGHKDINAYLITQEQRQQRHGRGR